MDQSLDISAIVGTYGLAVFLVIIVAWFAIFKYWPWYTTRLANRDAEEQRRHDQYLATQDRANDLVEKFTVAIQAVNTTMNSVAQLISTQTDRMDDYHREVMAEIRRGK